MNGERRVAGRYQLVSVLGQGGMGTVWQAYDEKLQRPVAVKEIRLPSMISPAEQARIVSRSLAEARHAARLSHPNIVAIYDVLDEDQPFIVMQLVEGQTLEEMITSAGPVDPVRAATIGLALLDAIDSAHAAGVVHRDVKPSNVILPRSGGLMLTDFSIATALDDATMANTGILGTPGYVAPERVLNGTAGPPADLFGVGATLYFAVEGTGPFDHTDVAVGLFGTATRPHPPAPHAGPLAAVLDGLLTKEPADRWTSATTRAALTALVTQPAPVAAAPAVAAPDDFVPPPAVDPFMTDRDIDLVDTRETDPTNVAAPASSPETDPTHLADVPPIVSAGPPVVSAGPSVVSAGPSAGAAPWVGSAAVRGPSSGVAHTGSTMAFPSVGQPGPGQVPHYAGGIQRQRGVPVWIWALIASVLVIGVAVGAVLWLNGGFSFNAGPGNTSPTTHSAGPPPNVFPASLAGTWRGTYRQSNGRNHVIEVVILADTNPAEVNYPGLKCTGTLAVLSRTETTIETQERITSGSCTPTGTMTFTINPEGTLGLSYVPDDAKYTATALLTRVS